MKKKKIRLFPLLILILICIAVVAAVIILIKSINDRPEPQSAEKTATEEQKETEDKRTKKDKTVIIAPVIGQLPKYPTGCESVSAVMALRFAGEDITVDDFIDNYLDLGKYPDMNNTDENGMRHGADPYEQFVGTPKSNLGFGCFSPVIKKALTKYFGNSERVIDLCGSDIEEFEYLISDGTPVIMWATMGMVEPYVSESAKWVMPNGEIHTWMSKEHCLLLVGYDENSYYFNDPLEGRMISYEKETVKKRYEQMGKEALAIKK